MWTSCKVCGALTNVVPLHAAWHGVAPGVVTGALPLPDPEEPDDGG